MHGIVNLMHAFLHSVCYAISYTTQDDRGSKLLRQNKMKTGVDLGGIPLSRAPQILRRNTRFAGTVIRPDYQLLPQFGDPILGLASLD